MSDSITGAREVVPARVTDGTAHWRCRHGQEICLKRCTCGGDLGARYCGRPQVHTSEGYATAFCHECAERRTQRIQNTLRTQASERGFGVAAGRGMARGAFDAQKRRAGDE